MNKLTRNEYGTITAGGIVLVLVVVLLVVGVGVGGYLGGWWLKEDATNRNTGIANDSLARQSALQDELIKLDEEIADLDVTIGNTSDPAQVQRLESQQDAMTGRFCSAYGKFTNQMELPQSVITRTTEECN